MSILCTEKVGDILALRGVYHVIAQLLHLLFEFRFVSCSSHAVVDGHTKFHLPTVASFRGTILLWPKALRFLVGIVFLQRTEAVGLADLIAAFPKISQIEFVVMELDAGLKIIGRHHKMIVQMIPVNVGSNDHFTITKALRQFQANVMGLLRGQSFLRSEGLYIVVEPHVTGFATEMFLRCQKTFLRQFRNAVDTGNIGQLFALVQSLGRLHAVVNDTLLCAGCLFLFRDTFNDRHRFHLQ